MLQEMLAKVPDHDYDTRIYLENCVKILESEIKEKDTKIYLPNSAVFVSLQNIGYDERTALVLAYFITNREPISTSYLFRVSKLDRGFVYRVCQQAAKDGILIKLTADITHYVLRNKENPFDALIQKKQKEITDLEVFKLQK